MSKPRAILIAEKPSYMRDLENCYNNHREDIPYEIDFMAQRGHAVELLTPNEMDPIYEKWDETLLPIEPESMGGFRYKVMKDMAGIYKSAKESVSSGEYEYVIHAGDPDQEGEVLTRLLLIAVGNKLPVLRLWANDTTEVNLYAAFKSMKSDTEPEYENLFSAGLVRQHADWRFGMNGSRAAGARFNTREKCAVGRVMTPVLAMIVNREDAIKNFVEKITYGISIDFAEGYTGTLFRYETEIDAETGEKKETREEIYYETEDEVLEHMSSISSHGVIVDKKTRNTAENPPALYDLAEAQIDAAKLGYSADQTLATIQSLYEKHIVTYPRTDCQVVSSTEDFEGILKSLEGISEYADAVNTARQALPQVLQKKKFVNDKELQKHGHSALTPTVEKANLSRLTPDEKRIYLMIVKRFLAIFQPPLLETRTQIITDMEGNLFMTTGKTIVDKGWTTFLGVKKEENPLPELNVNQSVTAKAINVTERKATPPKRFTNGTIVAAMKNPAKHLDNKEIKKGLENFHIGTSATRAEILKKLEKDKFIKNKSGTLYPTEWGTFFTHKMSNIDITKVDMTGKWEHLLEQVRQGEVTRDEAEEVMRKEAKRMTEDILTMEKYTFGEVSINRKTIGTCPNCGKNILESEKAFYCEDWNGDCGLVLRKKITSLSHFTAEEALKLFAGETIVKELKKEKEDENGKKKRKVWSTPLKLTRNENGQCEIKFTTQETEIKCPDCAHTLKREGSKVFCDCGFSLWTTIAGKSLKEEDLKSLIERGKTHKIKGFTSKKGKKFEAKLKLKREGKQTKIEFLFD